MSQPDDKFVDNIRSSSRQIVRELGFMHATLAATNYPPSAVHTIIELGARGSMTAVEIAEFLDLEKSSVSRMLSKLVDAGELRETVDKSDGRMKNLSLSSQGRKTLAAINTYGRTQVIAAIEQLNPTELHYVSEGLAAYARALYNHRNGHDFRSSRAVVIHRGYKTGAIGRIAELHANFYAHHAGFGQFFERLVATDVAEFTSRLSDPRNGMWLAQDGERIVGAIAVDGSHSISNTAHLRWFIVDEVVRGAGAGKMLLDEALQHCDAVGFNETHLWTFDSLHAARHLYEKHGFILAEEVLGNRWGKSVTEQRFVRSRPSAK